MSAEHTRRFRVLSLLLQRQPRPGVAGQTKKCVNCGVMLPASARFCKSCGRRARPPQLNRLMIKLQQQNQPLIKLQQQQQKNQPLIKLQQQQQKNQPLIKLQQQQQKNQPLIKLQQQQQQNQPTIKLQPAKPTDDKTSSATNSSV